MSQPVHSAAATPRADARIWLLGVGLISSCLAGALIGFAASSYQSWANPQDTAVAVTGAVASVLFALVLGFVMVAAAASAPPAKLANMVVAAGVVRMILSLSLGLAAFLLLSLDGRTFWTTFLGASLLSLVVETTWGMSTLKRITAMGRAGRVGHGAVE